MKNVKDIRIDEQSLAIEKRKRWNFNARFFLSGVVFLIFFVLLYVLFYGELITDTYRDIINILIGTYVAILTKTADYWFKEKDDPEHRESEAIANGG
jgi:cytochrome c biogenesis protein CcdA